MSDNRWQRIEDLFQRAVELAPGERSCMLDEACAGDPSLRGEVESLLDYDSEEGITFSGPARPAPRANAKSLSQGVKLGPYEISGLIGAGGMGEVYRARDPRLQRDVAIKVLPAEVSREVNLYPGRRQRFEREARAVAALNHTNIVAIYDVGEDRGVFFIVTELVEGEPLRAAGLGVRKALDIAVQIASGLAAAHQAGVVHRDLKPANILLTRDGQVKILDFGLAKVGPGGTDAVEIEALKTHPGAVLGTPSYMSPEQVKGQQTDHRTDIFSFGSILYELLSGQRAFPGIAPEAMTAILHNDPPDLPETVPFGVRLIVAHCLEKDPAKRFQSARDLSLALSALSQSSETSAPTRVPASSFRWPRAAWIALVAVAIAMAFTAGRWLWRPSAPPPHATVLTSFVGFQGFPSLSPDGNQFAFAWNGDQPTLTPHVYISLLGKGTPLRLTPENEGASVPSWSPDGQSIAFLRGRTDSEKAGIFVMPALGGPSRRISTGLAGPACWSPDGKWLRWSQREHGQSSVRIAPAGGGEERKLLDPPNGLDDSEPAVSPDGREVVWNRCQDGYTCALYLAGFQDGRLTGKPRQITQDRGSKGCPVWTHDGKEILYIGGDRTSELAIYRVRSSGGESRRIEGIGANAERLTLAAKSNRLLYSTVSINFDIRRADLNAPGAKPQRFISSTRYEGNASYSPDGKRIAFSSNRGGLRQIWAADSGGGNVSPLTSFPDGIAAAPKWSPDGHHIIFDARIGGDLDIYSVPADGGSVRRLTDHVGQNHLPSWSPDGKWIYFGSTRAGPHEIFRIRPDGSGVQQMTHNGGYYGLAAPDGKWLYYSIPGKGLWKAPADGGEATEVLPPGLMPGLYNFVAKERGIYAVGARRPEGYPVVLYSVAGEKPQTLIFLGNLPHTFLEVSPDGRWLLYTAADESTYEIMLVENFR